MNEALIILPFDTRVNVHAFTNSSALQRVRLVLEDGSEIVFEGSGENDHLIGEKMIQTPVSGRYPQGIQVTLTVNANGRDCPIVVGRRYAINTYTVLGACSEDWTDNDFNDSVVLFTWTASAVPSD